jgi:hypothetical protein
MHVNDPSIPPRAAFPSPSLALAAFVVACCLAWAPDTAAAQSLQGSTASLDRQNRAARQHDYSFLDTSDRVDFFAAQGWLIEVEPTVDFALRGVSFPYARPEVAIFLRRLGRQYRTACGEQLVVTSLTRPTTRQPRNASDRSVHPTGMALDLRYSNNRVCRAWLERVLLDLEKAGVLEATRERSPVHYHVALFPRAYTAYVDALDSRQIATAQERLAHTVRNGDSLWAIARSYGTTVDQLRLANQLASNRILVGQVLDVPLD